LKILFCFEYIGIVQVLNWRLTYGFKMLLKVHVSFLSHIQSVTENLLLVNNMKRSYINHICKGRLFLEYQFNHTWMVSKYTNILFSINS